MHPLNYYYANKILSVLGFGPIINKGSLSWDFLTSLIGKQDPVILDVGTNDGSHTQKFLQLFQSATIYSFEPDPRALKKYKKNIKSERAKLFDIAISDIDGILDFYVSSGRHPDARLGDKFADGWDMSGSIKAPKDHLEVHPWCKFDEKIQIESVRLDTWAEQHGVSSVDLIWADVQGAEDLLIIGGLDTLRQTRYLYTEYSDREMYEGQANLQELMALLPKFEVVQRFKFDVLLKNRAIK